MTGLLLTLVDVSSRKQTEEDRDRLLTEVNQVNHQLKALSHYVLGAQEKERCRIARELHDQIGQSLTAIKLEIQAARSNMQPQQTSSRFQESLALVEQTIHQVRDLSFDLRPSILDDLGLVSALHWYLDRQAQWPGYKAHFIYTPLEPALTLSLNQFVFASSRRRCILYLTPETVFPEVNNKYSNIGKGV